MIKRKLASPDTNRRTRSPVSSNNAPSSSTPRAMPEMTSEPSSTCAARPLKRIERQSRRRGRRRSLRARIPPAYSKARPRWPPPPYCATAPRRRHPPPPRRARRCASISRARRRRQRHIEPDADHHMGRAAGLGAQLDQHAADLAVLEPNIVRPLQRSRPAPRRASSARDTATPTPKLNAGKARARIAEGPGQRHGDARRRRAQSSAARAARARRAAARSCTRPRCRRAAARCSSSRVLVESTSNSSSSLRSCARRCTGSSLGADALRIQQLHRIRQAVAAPRQRLHLDAQGAQALHALPHGRAAHLEFRRQPFAGVQLAVRQQHQQRRDDLGRSRSKQP